MTALTPTPEPAIWSCDTGQWIPCIDSCQSAIPWISNVKDETKAACLGRPVSGVWPPFYVTSSYVHRTSYVCRAHAPANHAASHVHWRKMSDWSTRDHVTPFIGRRDRIVKNIPQRSRLQLFSLFSLSLLKGSLLKILLWLRVT